MKKLLVAITIALFSTISYSQVYVEGTNINDLEDVNYIQLVGINTSMFGVKIQVFVDYGQKAKMMKSDQIKDAKGRKKKFNSMIGALNFMEKNGWKFVNYTEAMVGRKLRYVYLMEKKK